MEEITQYLQEKYHPQAIILVGSRAGNDATPTSDWDLALYTTEKQKKVSEYFADQFLDIEFIQVPVVGSYVLQTSFAPDIRMKVLLDTSDGLAQKIIEKTLEKYRQGPEPLTSEERLNRRNKLKRFIDKIASRPDDEGYVFNYIGAIYEFGIRYWFELRQEWSQPIYKALPYIKEKDPDAYKLLEQMHGQTTSREKIVAAKQFYNILFS